MDTILTMIRKLKDLDKIEPVQEIYDFISKTSPFTEQNPRLQYLINEFITNKMDRPVVMMMNETKIDPITKTNLIKHFLLWTNQNTLFVGTSFIPEAELTKGVTLGDYEPKE